MKDLTSLVGLPPTLTGVWAVALIFINSVFFSHVLVDVAGDLVCPVSICGNVKGEPDHRQSRGR